ncbi:MAG: DNA alkylation repair protein [Ruminococcus sp.]|nr:DNA alkylation repair protein [Ruminococcus sp.]
MSDTVTEIRQRLFELADSEYKDFHKGLIPGYPEDRIIGVRTPALRKYAAEAAKLDCIGDFLADLPHKYYDENNLHAFIISRTRDFDTSIAQVEAFLPYIDNWATCDCWAPKAFDKHTEELLPFIKKWLTSDHVYTVRYAIGALMRFYLDQRFRPEYCELVAGVKSEEYYINMMIAWYFATALAKQYDTAVTCMTERRLSPWVHNKTIQKAVESYRIPPETKAYLKTLKLK